jgi:N-methylhydantoinase A
VPFSPELVDEFHRLHAQAYGYSRPDAAIEIVNLRVRAIGAVSAPALALRPDGEPDVSAAIFDRRAVSFSQDVRQTPFYRGEVLLPGSQVTGPAVILRSDTTILVGPSDHASVDAYENLWIDVGAEA